MSLDVTLYLPNPKHEEWEERRKASIKEAGDMKGLIPIIEEYYNDRQIEAEKDVFSANITHNLTSMADAVGIYKHVWRPEELSIDKAGSLIIPLSNGIAELKSDPAKYKTYSSSNGWGTYEQFIPWLEEYLEACKEYPNASINISR